MADVVILQCCYSLAKKDKRCGVLCLGFLNNSYTKKCGWLEAKIQSLPAPASLRVTVHKATAYRPNRVVLVYLRAAFSM